MSSFSRRAVLAGASAGLLSRTVERAAAQTTLRLLCWPPYDNAAASDGFRRAHDVAIRANHIGANDEIFTFLRAGGLGNYDVVTPSNGLVQPLAQAGLIQPLDLARLPNAAALLPRFQSPDWVTHDGQVYGVPLSWHTYPMVYNADLLPTPPESWLDLADGRFKGRIVMNDDVIAHVTTWNRALGAADPARVSKSQLNETVSLLISIKRDHARSYVGSLNEIAARLTTGGSWLSSTGQEIVPRLPEAAGANLRLARPRPGDFSVCDCLCIPAQAPQLDLAYAYLDHMISAEAQTALANAQYRGVVASPAIDLLATEVRELYAYDDLDAVFETSPLVGFPPLEADAGDTATYVDWVLAWDRIRFAPLQALNPPKPTPTPESSPAADSPFDP